VVRPAGLGRTSLAQKSDARPSASPLKRASTTTTTIALTRSTSRSSNRRKTRSEFARQSSGTSISWVSQHSRQRLALVQRNLPPARTPSQISAGSCSPHGLPLHPLSCASPTVLLVLGSTETTDSVTFRRMVAIRARREVLHMQLAGLPTRDATNPYELWRHQSQYDPEPSIGSRT
jgi:hypothetical protein